MNYIYIVLLFPFFVCSQITGGIKYYNDLGFLRYSDNLISYFKEKELL